jgi:hypothetical protein
MKKYLGTSKSRNTKKRHDGPAPEEGNPENPRRVFNCPSRGKMDGRTFGVQPLR